MSSPADAIWDERRERPRVKAHEMVDTYPQGKDHPFVQLAHSIVEDLDSANSAIAYARVYRDFFSWLYDRGIDPERVAEDNFSSWLRTKPRSSQGSRSQYKAILKRLYRDAEERELVRKSPAKRLELHKAPPINMSPALELDEIGELNASFRTDLNDPLRRLAAQRDAVAVQLMLVHGQRRAEVAGLAWRDLEPSDYPLKITVTGKGDERQARRLKSSVSELLVAWRATIEARLGRAVRMDEPVFPRVAFGSLVRKNGCLVPIDGKTLSGRIRDRMIDIGLDGPRYSAHALRATAATQARRAGADIVDISHMLRHKSVDQTVDYLRDLEKETVIAADSWSPPGSEDALSMFKPPAHQSTAAGPQVRHPRRGRLRNATQRPAA